MKMKFNQFRKNGIILGIIFLFVGIAVTTVGFGMGNFKLDYLREDTSPKWYRTVHLNDDGLWFGFCSGS